MAPGIRLARYGIDVFSGALPVLHEPEPRAVEEDLFCFILVNMLPSKCELTGSLGCRDMDSKERKRHGRK